MDDLDKELDKIIAQDMQELNDALVPETQPSDEEQVEKKARESGKPTKTTVLQRRTELSEEKLEKRIDQILAKHAGKIDEEDLRKRIADKLEAKGRITEADLIQIKDSLLRKQEEAEKAEENKSVPEKVADTVTGKKSTLPTGEGVSKQFDRLADWAMGLKTPGGIGFLIFVLMVFVWIIIPVSNGQTRMQLLFGVLTGRVGLNKEALQVQEDAEASGDERAYGGESAGSFGGTPISITAIDFGEEY